MFRRFTLLSSLVLAFSALLPAGQAEAQAPVRIMPLGDSITAGPGCWRAYLWNQLQTAGYSNIDFVGSVNDGGSCNPGFAYDFNHEGHSGFSITGIADANQLPPWLAAAQPEVIVMHLGTNDMWGGWIPLQTKITALTKLIGQMRAHNPGMKIVLSQIIPMDAAGCTTCMSDVIAFNNEIPGLAASLSTTQSPIYVVDQWTGFDVVADTYDRVHPVTSGFIKMANKFFPVVAQALNSGQPGVALTVSKAGSGSGVVTSNPPGINCGSSCAANYSSGASVTLTASAASNTSFAGWSGACSGTGACTVTMTQARAVTATFTAAATYALTVSKTGSGAGTVTSSPSGINCGSTCSANYGGNASVTLTASATTGSSFAGWSGACSGTGTCTVTMSQARNVTATFNTSGGNGGSCASPVTFSGNTGNFNTTGAVCYRTNVNINGWGCYNIDGRTVSVSGVARSCGQMPLSRAEDGYYYFAVTAGQYPWAGIYAW